MTEKTSRNSKPSSGSRASRGGGRRSGGGTSAGLDARRLAVEIVAGALARRQTLDAALDTGHGNPGLAGLEPRDRAFVKVLTSETLRRYGQISVILEGLIEKPLPKRAGITHTILAVAACQILFLDVPPHAAVDTAVRLANSDRSARHFRSLINAVLRRIVATREEILARPDVGRANTPDWLAERWIAAYGADVAASIMAAHLIEPPLDLSVKSDPKKWAETLGGQVLGTGTVRLAKSGDIAQMDGFTDGEWWVQDVAAALPAKLLGDVNGKRVLDLCAAPGGKTMQLAAAGANVTALDRSASRMTRLRANLERVGLSAEIVVADAMAWRPDEPFDAVLVDAPCSATGTLRRHPDIALIRREAEIGRLAGLQARLLNHAVELVKPGGTIVYATCSLEPEECEQQVEAILQSGAPLMRDPIKADEIGGLSQCVTEAGDLRTLPCHEAGPRDTAGGMDAFFAARLTRKA